MKICLLSHGLANGGIESFVLTLATGFANSGHDVTIAMAVDPDSKPQFWEDEARKRNINIHKLSDLGGVGRTFRFAKRLYRYLKSEKFDVFHANMDLFNGANMFIAWLAGTPIRVCHSHNSKSQYEEQSGRHKTVAVYRAIMRKLLWSFSTFRCGCSAVAMDYLYQNKWKSDPHSRVVYNGIDLTQFAPNNVEPVTSSAREKKLITVGRFELQKNPHFIVKVMRALCDIDSEYSLDWIGTGSMEAEIRAEIQQLGLEQNIKLLGKRKDVPDLLKQASGFLFPSLFEGLPIALIEAQAAGLTCVVSDQISPEVDMGKCHFVPLNASPEDWAKEIIALRDASDSIDSEKLMQFDSAFMVRTMEEIYSA